MSYDHHKKAGNEGDVVKHVALIAALDTILAEFNGRDFRYADTFAGYAYSPLVRDNEWENGINKVVENGVGESIKQGKRLSDNPHTKLWHEWYLRGRPQLLDGVYRPNLLGGTYPGSSQIASDVCRLHGKNASLSLWDTSPEVIANLMETYYHQGHRLCPRPARPKEPRIRDADFLFVDPPGASMKRKRDYPHWSRLAEFLEDPEDPNKPIMVWLPVIFRKQNGQEIEDTKLQRDDALRHRDFCATVVRWKTGIRTVGCQLLYRLPTNGRNAQNALRVAVEHVVDIAEWKETCPTGIQAVTHLP